MFGVNGAPRWLRGFLSTGAGPARPDPRGGGGRGTRGPVVYVFLIDPDTFGDVQNSPRQVGRPLRAAVCDA